MEVAQTRNAASFAAKGGYRTRRPSRLAIRLQMALIGASVTRHIEGSQVLVRHECRWWYINIETNCNS
ncbi:hypothetical protein SLEP1_g50094 [Rubroshorea leprosula]|uniref:Uncharacterized protein n=1 Tax=Rubroshorea leprosula TaxID=152421 RepID=A0AAV5M1D3_9ROSI|nr:hypothetical protein SLEP1_g50094 [Rubroshorea leprosula]